MSVQHHNVAHASIRVAVSFEAFQSLRSAQGRPGSDVNNEGAHGAFGLSMEALRTSLFDAESDI